MKLKSILKKNNRGSGIVTVLVAVIFLSSFGSLLLMLSYTGMEMRVSDRKGKENLYDASAVMDQMSAGVQEICSDAIVSAYSNTLYLYNYYGSDVTAEFQKNYRDSITSWKGAYVDGSGDIVYPEDPGYSALLGRLISTDGVDYIYNPSVLKAMVIDNADGNVEITAANGKNGMGYVRNLNQEIISGENPLPIVLEGVTVSFEKDGRSTNIISDITIDYPSIGYSNNTYNADGINQYACIARGSFIQEGNQGDSTVNGNAYFGDVQLRGSSSDSTMEFKSDGQFVIAGDVNVTGTADNRFKVAPGSALWADNIKLGTRTASGKANLLGQTYVANDLVLNKNSSAVLGGSYYGFGSSQDTASQSGAILVNGEGASLTFGASGTPLDYLMLCGRSFVGSSDTVAMGESISVKENQKAYLLPPEMLYYVYHGTQTELSTNPEKIPTNVYAGISAPDTELFPTDGFYIHNDVALWGSKTAADYGITSIALDPETFPGSSDLMVYFFASFDTQENANLFFKDYFAAHPENVSSYVNKYVAIDGTPVVTDTASNWIYSEGGDLRVGDAATDAKLDYINSQSESMLLQYQELASTLNMTTNLVDPDSPLDFILSDNIDSLGGSTPYEVFYDENGAIVALAANGDVAINTAVIDGNNTNVIRVNGSIVQNASPSRVCLIVTTGNILIDGIDYNGLLVAGGDIEVRHSANLNKDPVKVTLAYVAKSYDGNTITEYLGEETDDLEKSGTAWSVNSLVGYDKWRRTSEF